MKNNLANIQRDFIAHIFNPKQKNIVKIIPYSSQEALARLNIYRNNVFGNFSAVLEMVFETVRKIIGEKKFENLAKEYQLKYHSKSGNLDHYGDDFPQFLKKAKPSFLSDLARLELLYHNCYYAADADNFNVEDFQKLPQQKFFNLKFNLHPSCFLMKSQFAIFSLWKNPKKKSAAKKTEYLLITRSDGNQKIYKISQEEFLFLSYITQKKQLFEVYKKINQIVKKECDIGKILNKFIILKVIAGFYWS